MIDTLSETGLFTVGKMIDAWRSGNSNSYAEYTASARINPRLMVGSDLLFYEHTAVVTNSLHSAFSAYYLLAWNMLTVSIDNIAVSRHLDKLNPNRSPSKSVVDTAGAIWNLSNESYGHSLPRFGQNMIGNESRYNSDDAAKLMEPGGLVARSTDVIKDAANLSVGRMLEVQISSGDKKTTIPVMITTQASIVIPDLLATILAADNGDKSAQAQKIKYKSDQIGLLDLLTARNLVRDHKKALVDDKSGIYAAILENQKKNKLAGFLSLNPSVAQATSLAAVTVETIRMLELKLGDSFENPRVRQKVFAATGLFILAVVDTEYHRVTFYTDSIPEGNNVSIAECRAANKKNDFSITDMFKAFSVGSNPSF